MKDRTTVHLVAAARPNFMKIAPLYHALAHESWCEPVIVHTGQHYDANMSDAFFENLRLPSPAIHLGIGGGSHAEQTGKVMIAYEKVLLEAKPDLVVVVSDVNSTVAATLAAVKLGVKVAHLEAGLRSFDRTMPEEINRVVTDALADILWTPSKDGDENLIREGVAVGKIERVGNIMIDSLEMMRPAIEEARYYRQYDLDPGTYGVVTLHRPSNVDRAESLETLLRSLANISRKLPLVFPVHPRTRKNWEAFGVSEILSREKNVYLTEPLPYVSFMSLVFNCCLAVTDSGGIQEETTYLGIPCVTLRPNTERPVTVTEGTNQLSTNEEVEGRVDALLAAKTRRLFPPELWDGKTAARVACSIYSRIRAIG
jgi:UDP-N-acetylglucosamine 2-epimerase (non-hydrolysing)